MLDALFDEDTWRLAHQTVKEELDTTLAFVEGAVPPTLRGTLFRNGPGRFERGGVPYHHVFDGDGHLTRISFSASGISYRNRFVRTPAFLQEERCDKILHRSFGTNVPGGVAKNALRLNFRNAANTNIIWHGNRLLTLWEAGIPFEIDPVTLETRGGYDFRSRLRAPPSLLQKLTGDALPFSAHPKADVGTGQLFNFGMLMRPTGARLMLYEVDREGEMLPPQFQTLPAVTFMHDFALTQNYRVFLLCPTEMDFAATLLGVKAPADAMDFSLKPTQVLLVHRHTAKVLHFETAPGFIFHFTNAFEEGRWLVVDGFRYQEYPRLPGPHQRTALPDVSFGAKLSRLRIDTERGHCEQHQVSDCIGELPTIHPQHSGRPYRFAWAAAMRPQAMRRHLSGVSKTNVETGETIYQELDAMAGEALFVPRPDATGEDDGWVLSLVYVPSLHRSELCVLDAASLKVECRLRLPHHVPPGFHGVFVGEEVGIEAAK
jgi:all-trans-8'-apo-beta-carotenal 15,15'-oxygenase